jgi:hypothetical protein
MFHTLYALLALVAYLLLLALYCRRPRVVLLRRVLRTKNGHRLAYLLLACAAGCLLVASLTGRGEPAAPAVPAQEGKNVVPDEKGKEVVPKEANDIKGDKVAAAES